MKTGFSIRSFSATVLLRYGTVFMLLVLWEVAACKGAFSGRVLPSPSELLRCCWGFISGFGWNHAFAGQFCQHTGASLGRVGAGFLLACLAGIGIGALCAESKFASGVLDPLVQIVRSVPGITWLPIAIVWFGIGNGTAVFLIALAAFFPVYINTYHGISSIPPAWIDAARTLGAGRKRLILSVMIPAAWPSVCAGLRLALGVSWAYVVLGELTGVDRGLGAVIMHARMTGETSVILTGMICIAALGRISDLVLMSVLARLWRRGV